MPDVLMYNIESKKAAGVKLLCGQMGIGYREIEPCDFGLPIGALLGLAEASKPKPESAFDDELLYLIDFQGGLLDIFLNMLRKRRLGVALKAVMTESNLAFTSYELAQELKAEREAIKKGMTAHQ